VFEIAVCDLKAMNSSDDSWNMKSSEKRARLALDGLDEGASFNFVE
jgi:hypothetical protein